MMLGCVDTVRHTVFVDDSKWRPVPPGKLFKSDRDRRIEGRRFLLLFEHCALPSELAVLKAAKPADGPARAAHRIRTAELVHTVVGRTNQYLTRYESKKDVVQKSKAKVLSVNAMYGRWKTFSFAFHPHDEWLEEGEREDFAAFPADAPNPAPAPVPVPAHMSAHMPMRAHAPAAAVGLGSADGQETEDEEDDNVPVEPYMNFMPLPVGQPAPAAPLLPAAMHLPPAAPHIQVAPRTLADAAREAAAAAAAAAVSLPPKKKRKFGPAAEHLGPNYLI